MPCNGASGPESTLAVRIPFSGERPMQSVNVPPWSIQNRQSPRFSVVPVVVPISRGKI